MKGSARIVLQVAFVFAAGCNKAERPARHAAAPVAEQPVKAEPERLQLTSGMPYERAKDDLLKAGAVKVERAYHRPWGSMDSGEPYGYHAYFDLPDGRCLQLMIDCSEPKERAVRYSISPKHYAGKIEWFADREKGLIQGAASFDLELVK